MQTTDTASCTTLVGPVELSNETCDTFHSRFAIAALTMMYLLSLSIGIIAGLRTMTAAAAVSWAAYLGWLKLDESILAFMGYTWTPWVFTALAFAELIIDLLPSTPSRTVPVAFGSRILSGVVTGAALGISAGAPVVGAVLGATGAVIGTLGGRAARAALARKLGNDHPAALLEDVVAIAAALLIVSAFVRTGVWP
jgi:uncharacterized membrane protein